MDRQGSSRLRSVLRLAHWRDRSPAYDIRNHPETDLDPRRCRGGTEQLMASVAQHHKAISAHQSQLLAPMVELDRRKAWRVDGATSMVAWLDHALRGVGQHGP